MIRRLVPLLILLCLAPLSRAADPPHRTLLSVPGIELAKGERIKEFHVTIKPGRITALPRVPDPWKIKLVNDDDFNASLDASGLVGSLSVNAEWFQDFLEVRLNERSTIRVEIDLTTDWEKISRKIVIENDRIVRKDVP